MSALYQKIGYIFILSFLGLSFSYGQLIDLNSDRPYKKVFVDTDNFGASYLEILEQGFKQVKSDSVKLAY